MPKHGDLGPDDVVSVHRGTTGEERLLQLLGVVDETGILLPGTQVVTPAGTLAADGSAAYRISAAMASPALAERQRLIPPAPLPQVAVHASEDRQLGALSSGEATAVARGEIGNRDAAADSDGAFEVTALDPRAEYGGFAVDAGANELLACLDDAIGRLTDDGRIGYREWAAKPHGFPGARRGAERRAALSVAATALRYCPPFRRSGRAPRAPSGISASPPAASPFASASVRCRLR